jgi:hypothetical protein
MLDRKNAIRTYARPSSRNVAAASARAAQPPRTTDRGTCEAPRNIPPKPRFSAVRQRGEQKRPKLGLRVVGVGALGLGMSVTPTIAHAQTTNESQMWASTTLTAKLGGDEAKEHGPIAWLDLHARRGPDGFTGILRPALGWRFSPSLALYGGYAWVPFYADGDESGDVHEHRAWQQLIYQGKEGPFLLQLRPRLEQRFRTDEDVAFRMRLFGRLNAELWKDAPLSVATWDETFVQLGETSWGAPGGFDQNRLFLGLAYTAGEVRIEPGYLNVAIRRADDSLRIQHDFAINAFWSF